MEIYFLDVGQGDCAVIVSPSRSAIVIDCGGAIAQDKYSVDYSLKPLLNRLGITFIELIVLSHTDADHTAGLESILAQFNVGAVAMSNSYKQSHVEKDLQIEQLIQLYQVDRIDLTSHMCLIVDDIQLKCIYAGDTWNENNNDNSNVILVSYFNADILFTGDGSTLMEAQYCERLPRTIEILKVGHHGSKTSTSEQLLKASQFKSALISRGANNWFGHPHVTTLEKLDLFEITLYDTAIDGCLKLKTDGKTIELKTQLSERQEKIECTN